MQPADEAGFHRVKDQLRGPWLMVPAAAYDGAFAKAGFQVGDVIVKLATPR